MDSAGGVTVIGCDSPVQYGGSRDPDASLLDMIEQVRVCWHTIRRGGQVFFVLNPLVAQPLHDAGWSKRAIGEHVHERALVSLKTMLERGRIQWDAGAPEVWPGTPDDLDDTTMLAVLRKPEDLLITVAGGLQAGFCACIHPLVAQPLHDAGWSKRAIGEHVHERALVSLKAMLERGRMQWGAGAPELRRK